MGAIILLVLTSPRLAVIMIVFIPVIFVLIRIFARRARGLFQLVQERLDRLNTVLQENLAGIRLVKAFVRSAHEIARFDQANEALMNQSIQASQLMAIFMPFMLVILNMAIVGAIWIGGQSALTGHLSVGEVVAAINYLSFALFPILMMGGMLGPLAAADASASRIFEILDAEPGVMIDTAPPPPKAHRRPH